MTQNTTSREESINEMVRDFCSVVPKSKSEVRRRIENFRNQLLDELLLEVEVAKIGKEATKINNTGADYIFVYDLRAIINHKKNL